MNIEPFRPINNLPDIASGAKPPGMVAPRMFRQSMIKDRDNNIYAVYGDRLKKGTPDLGPWDVYFIEANKVKVAPGLVGGILPSNWDAEFAVGNGLSYMVADCQSDGKTITSASISNMASPPTQENPRLNAAPSSFKISFAIIQDGAASRTVAAGHISVSTTLVVTVQSPSPIPGLNVLDRYYAWKV